VWKAQLALRPFSPAGWDPPGNRLKPRLRSSGVRELGFCALTGRAPRVYNSPQYCSPGLGRASPRARHVSRFATRRHIGRSALVHQTWHDRVVILTIDNPRSTHEPASSGVGSRAERGEADPAIKVIIVTGVARRPSRRPDIRELDAARTVDAGGAHRPGQALFAASPAAEAGHPAMNGVAYGGGLSWRWLCHLRVCSERRPDGADRDQPGVMPAGGTQAASKTGRPVARPGADPLRRPHCTPESAAHRLVTALQRPTLTAEALSLAAHRRQERPAVESALRAVTEGLEMPLRKAFTPRKRAFHPPDGRRRRALRVFERS